jgi:hypothetical protein
MPQQQGKKFFQQQRQPQKWQQRSQLPHKESANNESRTR